MEAGAGKFNLKQTVVGALLVLTSIAAHPAAARAQNLQESTAIMVAFVTDSSGKPLSGAEVQVVGTSLRGNTDDAGRVALLAIPTGKAVLRVRRLGYSEITIPISVTPGSMPESTYKLKPVAAEIDNIVVRASGLKPPRYANTMKYDAFYRRMAEGAGTFLTREAIDDRRAQRPEDLLRMATGIRITYRGATPLVKFARCDNVNVYIDGIRSHDGYRDFFAMNPLEMEAIEIYHGLAQVPPEFSPRPNDCAAIVVWTRWRGKGSSN